MFIKNDNSFKCLNCGHEVPKLQYTSRDHCNECLHSLHVDIDPGDRNNDCKGILKPINVIYSSKSEYIIVYKCSVCGKIINNIAAKDDNKSTMYKIIENYVKRGEV